MRFILSDTHFNHKNIIRYCKRPFSDIAHMNEKIIENWNKIVDRNDIVYFLGDMKHGRTSTDSWLEQLNGKIFFLQGNHDMDIIRNAVVLPNRFFITHKGIKFLLMHEPIRPTHYNGWIIHGHIHNNNPVGFPFFNKDTKMINVSVEFLEYKPLNLDTITTMINV